MSSREPVRTNAPSRQEQMDREEGKLWRISLLFLVLMSVGLAGATWQTFRTLPVRFEALPVGICILAMIFGVYAWVKRSELAELRGLVRGLQESSSSPPTDRQVEQVLQLVARSQQGYRELIDSLDHVVFTVSLDGDVQLVNRRFTEILGLSFTDVIHHPLEEFLLEPTRQDVEAGLQRFLDRRTWTGVIRVRLRKTGALRYFDCIFHAVSKEGRVDAVSGLARDITAQRESEVRFSELFESLQEGVYSSTPEGKLLDANPAMVRILGCESKEELLAMDAKQLHIDPASRSRLITELEERGAFIEQETTLRRKDGSPVICMNSASCTRDASGRIIRIQGTLMDITDRLEMEKRLRAEQEFVRRLIASLPDAIFVLDAERRFTYVSHRIEALTGLKPEELVGKSPGDLTIPEDQPALVKTYDDLVSGRRTFAQLEYRSLHTDGSLRTLRADASPFFDADGKIAGVVASAHDVTESKRLEQQSIQREKLAAMGQMIAGVAHELNNPLTAILGVSDLLHDRATDDQTRRQTELVLQQARRAAQIVQGLLAFSRPPATSRSRIHVETLVRRALDLHGHSLNKNQIAVDLHVAPNLPPIQADASQLLQVFLNLIVNAEQAIHEVRDHGTIHVRLDQTGGLIRLSIQDDGPGIRPEILPKIFDPFFTTKRPGGGTGLGLTICITLVKEHDGSIEVQPAPGGGCIFRVMLPAAVEPVASESQRSAAMESLRGHSVLVVDDEEGIRELIQAGLSARGLAVECVSSSEEALARLASQPYDALLCDYNLPGLSGVQLFERLHSSAKLSPRRFVFMTGELLDSHVQETFTSRGAHVVQKPFQLSELASLLAEVFEPVASGAD